MAEPQDPTGRPAASAAITNADAPGRVPPSATRAIAIAAAAAVVTALVSLSDATAARLLLIVGAATAAALVGRTGSLHAIPLFAGFAVFALGSEAASVGSFGRASFYPAEMAVVLAGVLALAGAIGSPRRRLHLPAPWLPTAGWALFTAMSLIGLLRYRVEIGTPPRDGLVELGHWLLAPVALVFAGSQRWPRATCSLLVGAGVGATAHALVGAWQYATFDPQQQRPFGTFATAASRAGEIVANPNAAGVAAACAAVVALGVAVAYRRRRELLVAAAAVAAASAVMVALTSSRSAMVLCAAALATVATNATFRRPALAAIAVLTLLVLAVPSTRERLFDSLGPTAPLVRDEYGTVIDFGGTAASARSVHARWDAWDDALDAGLEDPIVGYGHGSFRARSGYPPDNAYIETFASSGLLATLGLLTVLVGMPVAIVRRVRSQPVALAAGCALAGFAVASLFAGYPWDARLVLLWWLLAAIGLRAATRPGDAAQPP